MKPAGGADDESHFPALVAEFFKPRRQRFAGRLFALYGKRYRVSLHRAENLPRFRFGIRAFGKLFDLHLGEAGQTLDVFRHGVPIKGFFDFPHDYETELLHTQPPSPAANALSHTTAQTTIPSAAQRKKPFLSAFSFPFAEADFLSKKIR